MNDNRERSWIDLLNHRDFEEEKKDDAKFIFSVFFFLCTLLYSAGIISSLFITQISHKFLASGAFFLIVRYFSRNKLGGRIVYGGMCKPWTVSLGATLLLLGFMFASREIEHVLFSIICLLLGFNFFYEGFKEGPFNGWDHYFRCMRGDN